MNRIGLIGNPNTGKTSLFNALTRSYAYIGNWSGVTVEKKVGQLINRQGSLTDLPGVYSLNPLSKDEGVTACYMLDEEPARVINVVDASQLERNLLLTLQLLEHGCEVVVALNMVDLAELRGIHVDAEKLSRDLGVRVVPVVARAGKGIDELLSSVSAPCAAASGDSESDDSGDTGDSIPVDYGPALERVIRETMKALPEGIKRKRWIAVQFLEGNEPVADWLRRRLPEAELLRLRELAEKVVRESGGSSCSEWIRQCRMARIKACAEACLRLERTAREPLSQRLDRLLTHRWLGIPIFVLLMFLTFKLTFDWVGVRISDALDGWMQGPAAEALNRALTYAGAGDFGKALIMDGIWAGVGGVIVFVPQIFILFFILSFIEDSGYMARIATVMDRLLEKAGLNGKAFISMIIGFGCNVPGVMAARTIDQPKERLIAILLTPLMSCSARLTVYSLFVGTFFKSHQAAIVLALYVMGIALALALAKLFAKWIAGDEPSVFVVELPPYRFPQWKTLSRSTWEKGKGFMRKAGTFILGGSVVIWLLSAMGPSGWGSDIRHSFLHMLGSWFAPLLSPLGFGSWQSASSLITGFFAKEVVVSTMNIIYAAPTEAGLGSELTRFLTPLQAFSFMAFTLLYVPCLATVGVIRKETGSARWTWFSVGYSLAIAYIVSLLIYRAGLWLGMQ